jgi:hypothetical protein
MLLVSLFIGVWRVASPALGQYDPHLVGWWPLDEGSGTVAHDQSGHGNDGTFVGDAQWVAGVRGGALAFDGDQVRLSSVLPIGSSSNTFAVWMKVPLAGTEGLGATERVGDVLGNYPDSPNTNWELHSAGQMRLYWNGGQIDLRGTTDLRDNTWHHVVWVRDKAADACYLYIDGRLEATHPSAGADITFGTTHKIGGDNRASGMPMFHGAMDDLQLYSRALSQNEIRRIAGGIVDYRLASSPQPADKAVEVGYDEVVLAWTPGVHAATHDVYLGTNPADVAAADRANPSGVLVSQDQTDPAHDAGLLAFGQTYYWRVDGVGDAPDRTIFKGDVWSFTVEPFAYPIAGVIATASSAQPGMEPENVVNGSGLNAGDEHSTELTDMWMAAGGSPNWIQFEFDDVHKLHEMWVWNSNQLIEPVLGFGAKDVTVEYSTDGQAWTVLEGVPEFAQAGGTAAYTANTVVDLGGIAAGYVKLTIDGTWGGVAPQTGLSEVRFLHIPTRARQPEPASGASDLDPQLTLQWHPGREAAVHEVCLSAEEQAVVEGTAPVVAVSEPRFDPGLLDLAQTYYWKVDEINEAAAVPVWEGRLWSFSTREYLIVDDFESYDDDRNRIYETWIDGWENDTGAQVGYLDSPFAEQTIVYTGRQSMPLAYGNASAPHYSEAERFFDVPQDWTRHGAKTLALHFRGAADNTGQLYVKINDTKVVYDGDAADIAKVAWQPWNIDLSTVDADLTNVTRLTIGVEGADATGILYIDDIRRYPKPPELITPAAPDDENLMGWWPFDEGTGSIARDQSGRGNDGTLVVGDGRWIAGEIDGALEFDGVRHRLPLTSLLAVGSSSNTVTAWIKVPLPGTENLGETQRVGIVLGNYPDTPNTNWELHAAGQLRLHWNGGQIDFRGTTDLRDNTWHHVAWVRDKEGNTCSLYIDGRLEASHPSVGTDITFGTTHVIGGDNRASGMPMFHGAMDDLRVYGEALSAAEIAWLAGLRLPIHRPF